MSTKAVVIIGGAWLVLTVARAGAQGGPQPGGPSGEGGRISIAQRQQRYQISTMERVFEGAVEHGATMTRERLRTWLPADMLLAENARVRGFRLEGYGLFFDVEVPTLAGTIPWIFRTLDQNDLGLESALKALRSHVDSAGDPNLQQAFKRVELQIAPMPTPTTASAPGRLPIGPTFTGAAAAAPAVAPIGPAGDRILNDPDEAYRTEIKDALMDAMLDHSRGLGLGPTEWLHVAARRNVDRTGLDLAGQDARTVTIRIRGADLTAYLAGQMGRDEARQRMEMREF